MKRSGALTLRYFIALLIAYVVGMNLFIYLKILGLEEIHFNQKDSLEMFIPLATTMGIEAAVSIGLLEYFVFSKWSHFSFLKFIVSKYLLLILTFISLSVLIHIGYEYVEEDKPFQALVTETVILLKSSFFLSIMLYMLLFSIFFNLLKTVSEYLGRQAIVSALLGRYQQPAEEDITFIFIDLKSSTSIAERLGHVKYSLFIDQCFRKLTESIYQFNASVYQFVGDEAVLVWKTKQAAQGIKPIHLYYDFCKRLAESQSHFMSQFGEIPHFRASIHAGMVAITEIHSVKKDIVYHGDVLNTCARIMAKCSEFNIDLLVSSTIAAGLKDNDRYMPRLLYTVALRGKEQSTAIYEITVR